jgi:CobQ-like glutamine amidotransferase family enzyme
MVALYGRNYSSRYKAVADLITNGASVVDVCCGPAVLFDRYLRHKNVRYTGLAISTQFIDRLSQRGGTGEVLDLNEVDRLPEAEYVVMHASLCHFLPNPQPIVERMFERLRCR